MEAGRKILRILAVAVLVAAMALAAAAPARADGDIFEFLYADVCAKAEALGDNVGTTYFKLYIDRDAGRTITAAKPCGNCYLMSVCKNNKARAGNGLAVDTLTIAQHAIGENTKSAFNAGYMTTLMTFDVKRDSAKTKAYLHVFVYGKDGALKEHKVAAHSKDSVQGYWRYEKKGAVAPTADGKKSKGVSEMTIGSAAKSVTVHPEVGGKVVIAVSKGKSAIDGNDPRYTLSGVLSCKKSKSDIVTKAGQPGRLVA